MRICCLISLQSFSQCVCACTRSRALVSSPDDPKQPRSFSKESGRLITVSQKGRIRPESGVSAFLTREKGVRDETETETRLTAGV